MQLKFLVRARVNTGRGSRNVSLTASAAGGLSGDLIAKSCLIGLLGRR
jgi:hypothetical protein